MINRYLIKFFFRTWRIQGEEFLFEAMTRDKVKRRGAEGQLAGAHGELPVVLSQDRYGRTTPENLTVNDRPIVLRTTR